VAADLESIPAEFCRLFYEAESSISEKHDPESVFFLAVKGVCTVFTNGIASVQNNHC